MCAKIIEFVKNTKQKVIFSTLSALFFVTLQKNIKKRDYDATRRIC